MPRPLFSAKSSACLLFGVGSTPEGAYIRAVDTYVVPVPIARHFLQIAGQARHIWKVGSFCCHRSFFF